MQPILTMMDTMRSEPRAELQSAIDRVGLATLNVDNEPGALQLAVDHLTRLVVRQEAGKLCDELATARAATRRANDELARVRAEAQASIAFAAKGKAEARRLASASFPSC